MKERRTTFVRARSLWGRSWKLSTARESNAFFIRIEKQTFDAKGLRSVRWASTKSRKHIGTNYSKSAFLRCIGVKPQSVFTVVTVCENGELICEYLILGSDDLCYDRAELAANSDLSAWNRGVDYVPTPDEIAKACADIRTNKPISDYAEQWLGSSGSKVREIRTEDIRHACFNSGRR